MLMNNYLFGRYRLFHGAYQVWKEPFFTLCLWLDQPFVIVEQVLIFSYLGRTPRESVINSQQYRISIWLLHAHTCHSCRHVKVVHRYI